MDGSGSASVRRTVLALPRHTNDNTTRYKWSVADPTRYCLLDSESSTSIRRWSDIHPSPSVCAALIAHTP